MKAILHAVALATSLAAASGLYAGPASAEEIDVKALAREACSSADIKKKFLDLIEEHRGKQEREISDFEIERDCAHFQLPDTPKYDTADPAPEATHTAEVTDVHYSADGKTILSASHDGTVRLWDAQTGKPISRIDLPAPEPDDKAHPQPAWVDSAVFVGDGSKIAVAMYKGPIRIFETATGKQLFEVPPELTKHRYGFAPHIAGTTLGYVFIATEGSAVLAFDTAKNAVDHKLPYAETEAKGLAVTEQLHAIAVSTKTDVTMWRPKVPAVKFDFSKKRDYPEAMVFSRDGKKLAVAFGRDVVVFDSESQKELQTFRIHPIYAALDMAFTADGNGIITCQSHPILWDIGTGKIIRHFGPFTDVCQSVDVSPDGKYAVTGSRGSDIRIWDIETGAFERRLGSYVKPKS